MGRPLLRMVLKLKTRRPLIHTMFWRKIFKRAIIFYKALSVFVYAFLQERSFNKTLRNIIINIY
jgi:hypothetical protein